MSAIRRHERMLGEARIAFPVLLLCLLGASVQAWSDKGSWLWVAFFAFGAFVYGGLLVSSLWLIREHDSAKTTVLVSAIGHPCAVCHKPTGIREIHPGEIVFCEACAARLTVPAPREATR